MTDALSIGSVSWGALAAASATTLALGRPWTARVGARMYNDEVRALPAFRSANLFVTSVWTVYLGAAAATTVAAGSNAVALLWLVPIPLVAWASRHAGHRYGTWRATGRRPAASASPAEVDEEQAQFRESISGRTDDEILELAAGYDGGLPALIDLTVDRMPGALDPAEAQDCVIGYEVATAEATRPYRIEVRDGTATVERRSPDDAAVVLHLAAPDYLRLVTGLLDGTEAFLAGKLHIRGDVMFAPVVARMFRTA